MSLSLPFPLPNLASAAADAHETVHGDWIAWAGWITLFLPLIAAAIIISVPTIRKRGGIAASLAIGACATGFLLMLSVFIHALVNGMGVHEQVSDWIDSGSVQIGFGVRMDALALCMSLVVTGVGLAIHVYALGYMKGDEGFGRFFGEFALFIFSMMGIVVSPNFFQTFVYWELVGVSSYLLIGYFWKKHSAGEAAKKAFMTNRVGDFGFLLGILTIWGAVGAATDVYTFDFAQLKELVLASVDGKMLPRPDLLIGASAAALGAALIFAGAMGKSAQFPLHVWLPDAMEGPTPVSALIHAATMVAAGIYMITRCFFLFEGTSWAPTLLLYLGTITALMAATMAITQRDIKKVLAYSTLSQLGYMAMALGAGAYTGAMFHLTTHAFFKALLFLGAGSVILGCHHEQDMFKMGGLKRLMPATTKTFAIGTLALCGIFPLAGFWSKDEILGAVLHSDVPGHFVLFLVGMLTAGLTAFYMGRVWFVAFTGKYRGDHPAHESPKVMTIPLWILAIFSVFIGLAGVPDNFGVLENRFEHFLHAWHSGGPALFHVPLALIATAVALAGIFVAWLVYGRSPVGETDPLKKRLGALWTLWDRLYYVDDFYLWLVKTVQQGIAWLCWFFERKLLIGAVINGTAYAVKYGGDRIRRVQSGSLSSYVTIFALGAVLVALLAILTLVA